MVSLLQQLLRIPVDYLPEEVSSVRVHLEGPQSISSVLLRDAFDQLLERHGFWSWDDESGGHPQVIVRARQPLRARGPSSVPFTARLVSLDELQAGPQPRLPLHSAIVPVEHLQARDQMIVVSAVLDTSFESLRAVEGNALLVKATREHLL